MKKRKSFLAKLLVMAVTITTVLPGGGALTANAATIKLTDEDWKVERDNNNWEGSFDDALNIGGVQTWRMLSSAADGNGHTDLSASGATATVYAKGFDITAPDVTPSTPDTSVTPSTPSTPSASVTPSTPSAPTEKHRKISFDVYPKGTAAESRFGVILKYVDATHFVYLGNYANKDDPNKWTWYLEWGNGIDYTEGTGTNHYTGAIADLNSFTLQDNTFHRITIEYLSSSEIKITMQRMKEQTKAGSDEKEWVVDEEGTTATTILNHPSIYAVKEYAVTGGKKPIHFGFLAGTFGSQLTDVDIANVQANIQDIDKMESWRYGYCDWTSPKSGAVAEDILTVRSVGGVNYRSIDALDSEESKTLYNKMDVLQNFSEGTISAVLRPYLNLGEPGTAQREFYLNTRAVTSASPGSPVEDTTAIKVGYNGTSWGYQLGNEKFVPVEGPKAVRMHDYKVDVTFEGNKFSAKVVEVEPAGDEDEDDSDYLTNDYSNVVGNEIVIANEVDLTGKAVASSGTISVTTGAGLNVRVRNVNYSKTTNVEFEDWTDSCKTTYNTVMGKTNDPAVYYKDAWETYVAARSEKSAILTGKGVITAQGARDIVNEMNRAWTAFDVAANKIATGKADLEAAKADLEAKSDKDYYQVEDDDWSAVEAAQNAIETLLGKIASTPGEVTSTEVAGALDNYNTVEATIKEIPAGSDDEAKITEALEKVNSVDEEKYYDAAKWSEYADALNAVKNLDENSTKVEVKEALDAFNAALDALLKADALRAATAAEISAAAAKISGIETAVNGKFTPDAAYTNALAAAKKLVAPGAAPTLKALDAAIEALESAQKNLKPVVTTTTPTVKAGDVVTSGKIDYTVADVTAKTVILKEGKDVKQKKVTIPATITIGKDTYKVVGVATNAFKNYKNIKNITIGANVTSIAKKAFPNCAKVTKVTFKTSKVTLGKNAFAKAKKTVKVKLPKSLKKNKKFVKTLKKAGLKKYKL